MKIAIVTDDEKTISAHFGRASKYVILTVEDSQIVQRETLHKAGHHEFHHEGDHHEHQHDARGRGFGQHSAEKHRKMFAPIADCQVLLARGMGRGARLGLEQMGIRAILTDIADIDTAAQAVIDDTIVDQPGRAH